MGRLRHFVAVVIAGLAWQAAAAQPPSDALRFGTIAALAPLCGLRDNQWAKDLQGAEVQALGSQNDAVATLSYAEDEAFEAFAETVPQATCGPLKDNPDLAKADEIVARYRLGAKV